MKDKNEIRQYIRKEKRQRSSDELLLQSEKIMSLLEMHERFQKAHVVLAFYALPDEPATQLRLETWAKHKQILLPVVDGDILLLREYKDEHSLREGAFHILEPQGAVFKDFSSIDLVIVPGVAFDGKCHRLGRGKGYYDKLLCHPDFQDVYKLGICFDFQKIDCVPTDANDIAMDEIL